MRRFTVHIGDRNRLRGWRRPSDAVAQNYEKHLSDTLQNAAQSLSLRTIKNTRVETVSVEEIKDSPPNSKSPPSRAGAQTSLMWRRPRE